MTNALLKEDKQVVSHQDKYSIHRILLPLTGAPHEMLSLKVARRISKNTGAHITILSSNRGVVDKGMLITELYDVEYIEKGTGDLDIREVIVNEAKNEYDMVILPSQRSNNWFHRLFRKTFSDIIPQLACDILRVYPSKNQSKISSDIKFSQINIFLTSKHNNPKMVTIAKALDYFNESKIHLSYITNLPDITPLSVAVNSKLLLSERQEFGECLDRINKPGSSKIEGKFAIVHKIAKYISNVINETVPDISIIGQTKQRSWFRFNSQSNKILSWTDKPVLIHYQANSK